jgi:iron complex transport system permease protein
MLFVAAVIALLCAPFVGAHRLDIPALLRGTATDTDAAVFWQLRVPRVSLAFLAGACLAICGMAFQAMFRNPLATPFTLGVSSGASLGATIYLRLGLALSLWGVSGITIFAFGGAMLSVALVYGLTRIGRGFSTATMLLAGIAVSFFFSSLILFMQYLSDFTQSFRILRWLMGGVEAVGYGNVRNVLPFAVLGAILLALLRNELNLLTVGDDIATSRGVNVERVKRTLFIATSLAIGGVVSACGPIGFVGMMAPHICRMMIGPNHRSLMPAVLLFGGTFLVVCDTFARTVIAPAEIPVGVITALLGGPFFVWLLVTNSLGFSGSGSE